MLGRKKKAHNVIFGHQYKSKIFCTHWEELFLGKLYPSGEQDPREAECRCPRTGGAELPCAAGRRGGWL